ncbi:hypothetical protein HMPREF1494_1331 [Bifidobacterium sp. MSTE12]|nr:hypothetical protein HMPREF1494_1331 [Bifidobacterium sp. MSTE12]
MGHRQNLIGKQAVLWAADRRIFGTTESSVHCNELQTIANQA